MSQKTRQSNHPQGRSKRNGIEDFELPGMRLKSANFTLFLHQVYYVFVDEFEAYKWLYFILIFESLAK